MKSTNLFLRLCLLLLTIGTSPLPAKAFGKKGHQLVAEIAFGMLDANEQKAIQHYLAGTSIPDAGTWMDDQKGNPAYNYMTPWHFINLDKGEHYQATNDHNVVNEINNAIAALRHREALTDAQIRLNILVLFHLTADIAQPLHVGYGGDKGGNEVQVTYINKQTNLHKVWDTEIIESQHITKENCLAFFGHLTDEQKNRITVTDPVAWMKDSRRLLARVYDFENGIIDDRYVKKNTPVLEKQLLYGGMRLAATLEELFGTTATQHTTKVKTLPHGIVTLKHHYYTSHFSTALHIPWVVEYTLRGRDVDCSDAIKRTNKFSADPEMREATDLDKDYVHSGYDRGHNMPAADNGCHGDIAMRECFYFSNMFPQTHKLNAGVWKTLEEQERDLAKRDDSVYIWIGNYGLQTTIGPDEVAVPKYCWKVIYDYKTKDWHAYIFPNTADVHGRPEDFTTTVDDIRSKSGFHFE